MDEMIFFSPPDRVNTGYFSTVLLIKLDTEVSS